MNKYLDDRFIFELVRLGTSLVGCMIAIILLAITIRVGFQIIKPILDYQYKEIKENE